MDVPFPYPSSLFYRKSPSFLFDVLVASSGLNEKNSMHKMEISLTQKWLKSLPSTNLSFNYLNILSSGQGRKRNIFQRGQGIFPVFFPGVKCFFPVEISQFCRPKTNFSGFEKWKAKLLLLLFSIFHLPCFNFPSFLLHFPLPLFSG